MFGESQSTIIIQSGSSNCRIGYSNQSQPQITFKTIIGHPKFSNSQLITYKRKYIGEQAFNKRSFLQLSYPIERGQVKNFELLTKIWESAIRQHQGMNGFGEKDISENDEKNVFGNKSLMLMDSMMCVGENNVREIRQIQSELMFEQYEVEKLYITNRTRLALYAAGLTTGLSVHSGDQLTQYVVCNEGRLISPNSYLNTYVAGGDVTDYLLKLLNSELNLSFVSSAEIQSVKHMKEHICYVVMDCQKEMAKYAMKQEEVSKKEDKMSQLKRYELPDRNGIMVDTQLFRAAEIMFNPSMMGQSSYSMQGNVHQLLKRLNLSSQLYSQISHHIVLSGGNSMIQGLKQRFQCELNKLLPLKNMGKISINSSQDREILTWRGGSILCGMNDVMKKKWVSKKEYQEQGDRVVEKFKD